MAAKKKKRKGTKRKAKKRTARSKHIPIAILKRRYVRLGHIIMKRKGHLE